MADTALHLIATLTARPGREDALHEALLQMLAPVRAEPGCLRYDLHRDRANPAAFVMIESWAGDDALAAHEKAPPFAGLAARFDDLLAGPPDLLRLERLA